MTPEEAAEAAASLEAVVIAEGPLTPAELDTLFGPAALFPDQVLTSVLVAVTFPLDVVKAARFVEATAASTRSVRPRQPTAMGRQCPRTRRFPDLVTRMSDHIDWTEQAGEAWSPRRRGARRHPAAAGQARENGYLVDNEAQKRRGSERQDRHPRPVRASSTFQPMTPVVYTTPVRVTGLSLRLRLL